MQSSRDGRKGVPPRQFLEADHLIQLGVWTTFASATGLGRRCDGLSIIELINI
jgi:hypothetical protein